MHITVGIVLGYLNRHTYILISTLAGGVVVVVCQWVVVAGYYFYYCLSDNQRWLCTKIEGAVNLPLGQSTGRDRQLLHT